MSLAQSLLPEFDHEMKITRRLLERVPEDRATWKPHQKSMSLEQLAMHIANLPSWITRGLMLTEFDLNPPGGIPARRFESTAQLLATFDANVAEARAAIEGAGATDLTATWTLKNAGQVAMTMPRATIVRSWAMNHIVHHRGQLSVYLRLNDVPLPMIYGPSADTKS
jgi:uncharacterized damage-inducible protein DinB